MVTQATARVVRGFRAAIQLLTRIPLPAASGETFDATWASAFFPLVGAAIGAFSSAIYAGSERAGPFVAATAAVAAALLLTGALHEDGLADTADALSAHSRERFFEILKDSRIGTFGASALTMGL